MRKPCGWFEDGELCGKPSVSQMGTGEDAWPLCAQHEDEVIEGAKVLDDFDETSNVEELIENDPGRKDYSTE